MSQPKKILLLREPAHTAAETVAPLQAALTTQGTAVRCIDLHAPYDALLDALADGWMPVLLPPQAGSAGH